jgi:hypothetical protein
MRYLAFLAVLLFPLTAKAVVSPATCSETTDVGCFLLDYANEDPGGTLVAYRNVVNSKPEIAIAMDYNALTQNLREAIWDKMAEAHDGGAETGVDDLPNPADMCGESGHPTCDIDSNAWDEYNIEIPFSEATPILAAKFAHALWVEVNGIVPWSLADMSQADLNLLFDPDALCLDYATNSEWNPGTGVCYFSTFVDHSPKRVYDVAIASVGTPTTQAAALYALVSDPGNDLVHWSGDDARSATTIDQTLRPEDMTSRRGCHTASRIMVALARSLNIPSQILYGWLIGEQHSSAYFSDDANLFLAHGDDIYQAGRLWPLQNAFAASWAWASTNLAQYDADNALKNSRNQFFRQLWYRGFVRGNYKSYYCANGENIDDTLAYLGIQLDSPQDDPWKTAGDHELDARITCP